MRKLRCLIVDDEPLALQLVEGYVLKTPFLHLSGISSNAAEALKVLENQEIDLVFLDIQMPGLNGLELGSLISTKTRIIFTTAFSEYAIDGYKVNALDYLLKPFNYQEFLGSAKRAYDILEADSRNDINPLKPDFIYVKSEYKMVKIDLSKVYYFEGLKDYIKIWVEGESKSILTLMSLKSLQEKLPSEKFMRIHRSFIVSLKYIVSIERNQVIMPDGQRITISDQFKDDFNEYLNKIVL